MASTRDASSRWQGGQPCTRTRWTRDARRPAVHFPHLLVLRIEDAPISGTVTYEIQRSGAGSVARVHNQGSTTKWNFIPSSMVEGPMRKAMSDDLARLKRVVESGVRPGSNQGQTGI